MNKIVREAALEDLNRQSSDDVHGFFRARILLRVKPETVDLFHNGAGGYRAQFYCGVRLGDKANRTLLDKLIPTIGKQCRNRNKWTCPPDFVKASIADGSAKAWIHQGATWPEDTVLE